MMVIAMILGFVVLESVVESLERRGELPGDLQFAQRQSWGKAEGWSRLQKNHHYHHSDNLHNIDMHTHAVRISGRYGCVELSVE